MVDIGTVTGLDIRKNRDGGADVRLLQVQMVGDDVQTVQYMPMAGDDSPPQVGDKVAIIPIGPAFQVAVGVQDSVTPSAAAGERLLYSRDASGALIASVHLKKNGAILISNALASVVLNANGSIDIAGVLGTGELKTDGSWDLNGVLMDLLGNMTVPGNLGVGGSIGGGGVSMDGGTLTADAVETSGGIDLDTHKHGGVTTGGGQTGGPV